MTISERNQIQADSYKDDICRTQIQQFLHTCWRRSYSFFPTKTTLVEFYFNDFSNFADFFPTHFASTFPHLLLRKLRIAAHGWGLIEKLCKVKDDTQHLDTLAMMIQDTRYIRYIDTILCMADSFRTTVHG